VRSGPGLAPSVLLLGAAFAVAGCRMDMQDQPRYEPDAASAFFADGRADRPAVEGAVPRGGFHENTAARTGLDAEGRPIAALPVQIDARLLARGRERYDIYCSPCHSRVGDGDGMIVQRGYRRPTSFHDERLRAAPAGYFFDVISRGFGVMPSYAAQVAIADRWAIVAYVRALQLSQHYPAAELAPAERARLDAAAAEPPPAPAGSHGEGHG
jgi:mono/diheme cytochrome c family protein